MKKIAVTGGSGKAGVAVVRDLIDHGYQVLNIDTRRPAETIAPTLVCDLADFGETTEAMAGADAVVHLAAIPAPGITTEARTFANNMLSTYNVFSAAAHLNMSRVVWASSETILGLPFDREKPAFAPITEEHPPYPESSYALAKLLSEEAARQFNRTTGIPFVGLRFSNIMNPEQYDQFPSFWDDPMKRKWNLWGYVDADDVAQSCRLGLEADIRGAEVFIIAASDTVMNRSSRSLMELVFPSVPIQKQITEFETLLSIDRARAKLGYAPRHTWRTRLG